MLINLVLRNISRYSSRFRPFILAISLVFLFLFIGNSVLRFANQTFYDSYTQSLTGDLSFSDSSAEGFTLFGSNTLLVGEYLSMPVLSHGRELVETLQKDSRTLGAAGVVIGLARMEFGEGREDFAVFGVDFNEYLSLFSAIELVSGAIPEVGHPGVLLREDRWLAMDPRPKLGDALLFIYSDGNSFTLREAPLRGIIRYEIDDQALDRTILIDASTARSLFGILNVESPQTAVATQDKPPSFNLDSLFESPKGTGDVLGTEIASTDAAESTDVEPEVASELWNAIDQLFLAETAVPDFPNGGSYHFVLTRLRDPVATNTLAKDYPSYRSLNWRETGGGTVQLVWALQLFLNGGLVFLVLGAVVITSNSLMLSVFERRKELGTMRALGADKRTIGTMVLLESTVVIFSSAALGVLFGVAGILVLNTLGLRIENPYLDLLFGGSAVRGIVDAPIVLAHFISALVIALGASLYPVAKVLAVSPAKAMSS